VEGVVFTLEGVVFTYSEVELAITKLEDYVAEKGTLISRIKE